MAQQIPLFQPPSEWTPPEKVPNLSEAKEIAVDLETYDPDIKTKGPGWAINNGYIAGVAIAVEGWKGYFPIRHEGGGNFDEKDYQKALGYELKNNKIESEKVLVNWRDVESITKAARKLILQLSGNEIFINISSGSKTHAIALDRAIMTLDDQEGITEFYAESQKYEGFKPGKQQLSVGVKDTKEIPKRNMVLPSGRLLSTLTILYDNSLKQRGTCTFPCYDEHKLQKGKHNWGSIRKKELASECVKQNLLPSTGNVLTSLDKNIIQKCLIKSPKGLPTEPLKGCLCPSKCTGSSHCACDFCALCICTT